SWRWAAWCGPRRGARPCTSNNTNFALAAPRNCPRSSPRSHRAPAYPIIEVGPHARYGCRRKSVPRPAGRGRIDFAEPGPAGAVRRSGAAFAWRGPVRLSEPGIACSRAQYHAPAGAHVHAAGRFLLLGNAGGRDALRAGLADAAAAGNPRYRPGDALPEDHAIAAGAWRALLLRAAADHRAAALGGHGAGRRGAFRLRPRGPCISGGSRAA